ncbi:MraY family glycosyltransferase [Sulfuriflexus mobilis]|uniref:MraY family glycosyltransferase n=1 Tax=Sulfuriflexus mobilis TaxID=1811807 RepID=UPI000F81F54A|nr:glycosyltransferase family 4 protein [Sulfuriflexus mobilis]
MTIVLLLSSFLVSVVLTIFFRRYAISRQVIDVPNVRSSHAVATPRGGGAAIVITFLLGLAILRISGLVELNTTIAMTGVSVLVAGIGFWDDHRDLSAKWRLVVHFFSAFWVIYWLNSVPTSSVFVFDQASDWLMFFLASVSLVWLLNLYNFMDGIDGIAASETIFISGAIGYFAYIGGHQGIALLAFVLAMATSGFLVFNWPPARIFMGDAGSGFLGIVLGALVFALVIETSIVWPWLLLFGVFLVDATVTLISRFLRGERWYEAHCSHAYQQAARKWGHLRVTLTVNIVNCCWLLPLTYIAYKWPESAMIITMVAFAPLVLAALMLGAGRPFADDR